MAETGNQFQHGPACLLGLAGGLNGRLFRLREGSCVIGRDPTQCQLVLALAVISRRHAVIELNAQQRAIIRDLDSGQGTYVNGERVVRCELRDGDRVGFGPDGMIAFTYRATSSAPTLISPTQPQPPPGRVGTATTNSIHSPGLFRPAPESGAGRFQTASAPVVRIGRAPDNDLVLDAPGVSRYHAALNYNGGAHPVLTDLNSTNGTFVNGEPLAQPRPLQPDDLIVLGGYLLRVNGRDIQRQDLSVSRITAWQITKEVPGRTLLNEISLAIAPREFVGLMGPSGCGKSTLMDALNGLRPATSGSVYINDLDLYRNFDAVRRSIGHVPQRDILHDSLTVERTLYYAARLRLPETTPPAEIDRVVAEVIATVGLQEQCAIPFKLLSGGQQKRLSLGIELLTKPSFIFLDEPTSPLDPETTENMMLLFRGLADEGRIVVMVTHKFEKFEEMHQVAILTKDGRLAFFGPPRGALDYFGCREPGEIYRHIGARDPDELSRAYAASPYHQQYVEARIAETHDLLSPSGRVPVAAPAAGQRPAGRRFGLNQWLTLTRRYLEIKLNDKRNTALLLLQAPLIALILTVIVGDTPSDAKTLFIAAIISIWFGANNAVREIVAEAPIYTRERLVNLKIPSYVFSKYVVLSGIALLQCLLFVAILTGFGRTAGGDFGWLTLTLYLTSLGGSALGLFFSALVNSTEKAMSILPLLLIPQLLLSGFLKPLDDLYVTAGGSGSMMARTELRGRSTTRPKQLNCAASLPSNAGARVCAAW
ncbi:MAG: FHA domain-containing protein [Blastocatellia bacterium]